VSQLFPSPGLRSCPGVEIEGVLETIARGGAAEFDEHVDVAIAVQIAASDAVAFLQMPGSAGRSDVDKFLAGKIAEHAVGHEGGQVGIARRQIEIEEAIVIEVGEVAPPWWRRRCPTPLPW